MFWYGEIKRLGTARRVQELQLKFASHWIWYWFQCKTSIYCWVCLEPTRIHRNNGRLLRPLIFGKGLLIDNCLNAGRTFAISSMGISLNVDFRFWTLSVIWLVCIGFVNQIFTGLTKMLTNLYHTVLSFNTLIVALLINVSCLCMDQIRIWIKRLKFVLVCLHELLISYEFVIRLLSKKDLETFLQVWCCHFQWFISKTLQQNHDSEIFIN